MRWKVKLLKRLTFQLDDEYGEIYGIFHKTHPSPC